MNPTLAIWSRYKYRKVNYTSLLPQASCLSSDQGTAIMKIALFKLATAVVITLSTMVTSQDYMHLIALQRDLSIPPDDFKQIFSRYGNGFMDKKGTNCLRSVFAQIGLSCNDLESDSSAMNRAAILLTNCDLEGTELELPRHCEVENIEGQLKRCLQHIEKSNQLWTTFTIHKQNLLAQCYALKRLYDEDEARNLYHTAIVEKVALLKLLQAKFEENQLKMQQEWFSWQQLHANARERETALDLISSKGEVQLQRLENLVSEARDWRDKNDNDHKTRIEQSLLALSDSANEFIHRTSEEITKSLNDAMTKQEGRHRYSINKQNKNFEKQIAALASIELDLSTVSETNQRILAATYDEHIDLLRTSQTKANQISTSIVQAEGRLQHLLDLHTSHTQALLDEVLSAQGIMKAASALLNETVTLKFNSGHESSWIGPALMRLFPKSVNLDVKLTRLARRYRRIKALIKLSKYIGAISAFILRSMADALCSAMRKLMGGSMIFMLLWKALFRKKFRRIIHTHLPAMLANQEIKLLERNIDDPERAPYVGSLTGHLEPLRIASKNANVLFDKRQRRLLADSKGQLCVDRATNNMND